ncbi:hypothetical protein TNCV_2139901 [Trichonephila clavipes]|uniref:Transposase Tc1-like domain-containing protein n=1 Tax=Trichonephila clavipes TaxID=2585209 RepID=A0A8X6RXH6_TRICX|nr:hypothetical protein TNCV_2139901 [Trichonephila clavipes]
MHSKYVEAQTSFRWCGVGVIRGEGVPAQVVLEVRRLQKTDISSRISKRNRRTTAQQVANQFLAASGKQISRKTVARRLRGGGLYARRPVVCVPLTDSTVLPVCNGVVSITIGLKNEDWHA